MNQKAASITELNTYIKMLLDNDEVLQNVYVLGEISNFKKHSSGHLYFSLKDEKCSVKCMMFSYYTSNINFNLENGIKVFAYGNVSCYEPMGQYQIYIYHMAPAGIGEINESLKKLFKKLESEGIFDESRKKKLKKFPKKIGVVTSKTGAAIQDIMNIAKRRNPYVQLVLYHPLVLADYTYEFVHVAAERQPVLHGAEQAEVGEILAALGVACGEFDIAANGAAVTALNRYARERLTAIEGVTVNSPEAALPYVLSITAGRVRSETMLHFLAERGVYVSSGSACAKGKPSHVLQALGLSREQADSTLRVSFCKYNTVEDIDALCEGIAAGLRTLAHR